MLRHGLAGIGDRWPQSPTHRQRQHAGGDREGQGQKRSLRELAGEYLSAVADVLQGIPTQGIPVRGPVWRALLRSERPSRLQAGHESGGHHQAGGHTWLAALLCHTPHGSGYRHRPHPKTPGPREDRDNIDLHPGHQPRNEEGQKPIGQPMNHLRILCIGKVTITKRLPQSLPNTQRVTPIDSRKTCAY